MKNEYGIINKTALEKRIEELEREFEFFGESFDSRTSGEYHTLKKSYLNQLL